MTQTRSTKAHQQRRRAARWIGVAAMVALAACSAAGELNHGAFVDDSVSYTVGEPGRGWQPLAIEQANIAWHAPALGASLLVNSHCEGVADAPLESLTNDLLMGTTERAFIEQQREPWSKREGLSTHVLAKLDGVLREFQLFVLKKDGCVYDLVLEAPPEHFAAASASYANVRAGFDVRPRPSS